MQTELSLYRLVPPELSYVSELLSSRFHTQTLLPWAFVSHYPKLLPRPQHKQPGSLPGHSHLLNDDNPLQSQPLTQFTHDREQKDSMMSSAPVRRARSTRNAANKASVKISTVAQRENSPEGPNGPTGELLDEALTPMRYGDQTQWKAWVEIESEPAFFNGLLRDLGVEDVKIVEVFTVDPNDIDMVQLLPQPVLGFVFLSKYVAENKEATDEIPADLWFANQTMANGCATLALLNILMNKPSVHLGSNLTAFKSSTAALAPPVRGWLLEENPSLRQVHNSYARCLEHLNSDLLVSNEYEDCGGWPEEDKKKKTTPTATTASNNNKRARKTTTTTATASSSRKKRRADEDACHYKAFLHFGGQVWVLDGLEDRPVSLGPADPEAWVFTALAAIQAKMQNAGDDMVNILAVCQSPTVALRRELLVNIRTLAALRAALPAHARPGKSEGRLYLADDDDDDDDDDHHPLDEAALARYGVTRAQLDAAAPDAVVLDNAPTDAARREAVALLEAEQARIQREYMQEMGDVAHEEERCSGRKRDYGRVVHRWVKKLAERGELQGLVG